MSINVFQSQPKGFVRFTSSQNWVVPIGVSRIKIITLGGGGGGGGGYSSTYTGGGGGSGGIAYAEAAVNPGDVLSIQIGAGGAGGTGGSSPTAGGSGGNTEVYDNNFSTSYPITGAGGGGGGGAASSSANGTNGSAGTPWNPDPLVTTSFGINGMAGQGTGMANAPVLPLGSAASTSNIVTLVYWLTSAGNCGLGGDGGAVNSNGGGGIAGIVFIWWGD